MTKQKLEAEKSPAKVNKPVKAKAKAKDTSKKAEAVRTGVNAKAAKAEPAKKTKLVRDSFTIPKVEYQILDTLKKRAALLERPVRKSELLRAGIAALDRMQADELLVALNAVPSLKTGRPAK